MTQAKFDRFKLNVFVIQKETIQNNSNWNNQILLEFWFAAQLIDWNFKIPRVQF